jgi:hypothetical protein
MRVRTMINYCQSTEGTSVDTQWLDLAGSRRLIILTSERRMDYGHAS